MFRWLTRRLTRSPSEKAARLRIVSDDPESLGDKPGQLPGGKAEQ